VILAFPLHSSLPVNYDDFGDELKRRGTNKGHSVLVIARPEDEEAAVDLGMELGKNFSGHAVEILPATGLRTIEASNRFFQTALRSLVAKPRSGHAKKKPPIGGPTVQPENAPMLYLDPRYRPNKTKWLDELQSEYFAAGAPAVMCGPVLDVNRPDFGPAILVNKNYPMESGLLDFLDGTVHWRKFLASELINRAVFTEKLGIGAESLLQLRPDHAPKTHRI